MHGTVWAASRVLSTWDAAVRRKKSSSSFSITRSSYGNEENLTIVGDEWWLRS
ncbi:hypothetical protein GWR56_13795 [Mucilaginibacter sp. 14171R-50]|uniref:hypothetical protein n=1 Tax=Mucilaginibacter sp. 14171R-50 TaxID=2703789 RepID=UPI00138DB326|nr:hypothetical protein [Mucilaginibacter sp. 14171R-50]QHS56562.1 hypothetical protein GWR56_13795 [Mucilaginibacter sp. 14171R-50]